MNFKYLHETGPNTFYLDHRITPEVRALFTAMCSRMPAGGIRARYTQVLAAIAEDLYENHNTPVRAHGGSMPSYSGVEHAYADAERLLTEYPLHPIVQTFFYTNVEKYGHSSPLECAGGVPVFVEGVSWLTCYELFDTPLVIGQEFSTRAVRHKDWPLAQEILDCGDPSIVAEFEDLHRAWLTIFNNQVNEWKGRFSDPEVRRQYGVADKEPFRPALDRARWALPGSFATGAAYTSHLRDRARAVSALSDPGMRKQLTVAYEKALPGFKGMGLRGEVSGEPTPTKFGETPQSVTSRARASLATDHYPQLPGRSRERTYADPTTNRVRYNVYITCSLAVLRDWHRHRTLMPWSVSINTSEKIHGDYEVLGGDVTEAFVETTFTHSFDFYDRLREKGLYHLAVLALPMGTECYIEGEGGLRDVLYMAELRAHAHGSNFEYKAQAQALLEDIKRQTPEVFVYPEAP